MQWFFDPSEGEDHNHTRHVLINELMFSDQIDIK